MYIWQKGEIYDCVMQALSLKPCYSLTSQQRGVTQVEPDIYHIIFRVCECKGDLEPQHRVICREIYRHQGGMSLNTILAMTAKNQGDPFPSFFSKSAEANTTFFLSVQSQLYKEE